MMSRLFRPGAIGATCFVIVSSIIFALTHWEQGGIGLFESLVFGLAAATIYRATENIWPLSVGHAVVDFLWLTRI
jgi:membrane protease YdiL (CAAX protease family)